MKEINPLKLLDSYKTDHRSQYPENTERIVSNWTPRGSRIPGITEVVHFGLQGFIKEYLIASFNKNFFNQPLDVVMADYKRRLINYGANINFDHIEQLHKLGYLPIEILSLPEGISVPLRCPMFLIFNTKPEFFWLTNYLETLLSTEIWKPMTSATIAKHFRKTLDYWALKTTGSTEGVQWQGHDFSMRGMSSVSDAVKSGAAHLLFFTGSDTIPAVDYLEQYYNADSDKELIAASVPATEHSVMSLSTAVEGEFECFKRLITQIYPTGIVSIVSDTFDLWKVCTDYLPRLKSEVLARDGKVVIRPDSGDPVDIICGTAKVVPNLNENNFATEKIVRYKNKFYGLQFSGNHGRDVEVVEVEALPEHKGVIELLWDVFGGDVNELGYKVLDPHIGAIYGDSITNERAEEICKRLEAKGFASTNIVFGIGSYTYEYQTRDTFQFAVKATYGEVGGKEFEIFKDPITSDGMKKSLKGLIAVYKDEHGEYFAKDQATWKQVYNCEWMPIFKNGKLLTDFSLEGIRKRANELQPVLR